jgi:hypothetical protein
MAGLWMESVAKDTVALLGNPPSLEKLGFLA